MHGILAGVVMLLGQVQQPYATTPQVQYQGSSTPTVYAQQTTTVTPGVYQQTSQVQYYGSDPYGFAQYLNSYRASAGLPPLAYDANLSGWASSNNAAQCSRGLGHFVNPGCNQNSGMNYSDAYSVYVGWVNSPGHRATLLAAATRFGISYGPGPFWTLNVQ